MASSVQTPPLSSSGLMSGWCHYCSPLLSCTVASTFNFYINAECMSFYCRGETVMRGIMTGCHVPLTEGAVTSMGREGEGGGEGGEGGGGGTSHKRCQGQRFSCATGDALSWFLGIISSCLLSVRRWEEGDIEGGGGGATEGRRTR